MPDDVILGHVEYKKSYGVHIQIDSFEGGKKHRYISDLNIQVYATAIQLYWFVMCHDVGIH